ncbi:hypothetical protein HOLleu_37403 [Holothuria leucospilota]|uniref:Uncharacterized protein n=1 Tax=Holothuria leucospilota TaxID=206669 RepID=A0A9Q0YI13_HOLLE|nr:hypothetical protein HOLleu_37403 [Holothuria leucospilota]
MLIPALLLTFPCYFTFAAAELQGLNLSCYDCKSYFKDKYVPDDCIANLAGFYLPRQCQRHDKYCMVKVVKVNRIISTFERDCTSSCIPQCVLKGLGTVTETCTYCCNNHIGCNEGNRGRKLTLGSWPIIQVTFAGFSVILVSTKHFS